MQPEFIETPGFGEEMGAAYHHSQAVRIGNRIELSGHGGWTDSLGRVFPETVSEEVTVAFENVERTLKAVGASWKDVISLTSYHAASDGGTGSIDSDVLAQMMGELRNRMPDRRPIWTAVSAGLVSPEMHIEIAVTAIVGE